MTKYFDVVLIHPPSFHDFRKRPILPGPIDRTVPIYTYLFIMFPVGMISMASFLDEKGVKVRVFNLAEKMLVEKGFDVEEFISNTLAQVYAIGLHWSIHTEGAIEIARICKTLHPDSVVVLGGLTATCFAEEIVQKFDFVDAVVKGEGEIPLYELIRNLQKYDVSYAFCNTPNLTFRDHDGKIISTEMSSVVSVLDDLDFVRLDLVEPIERTITSPMTGAKLWNIPICRGCLLNCASCGGSKYSYHVLLNRRYPAFRSPRKIFEDFARLDELGVKSVFLFQDPRMGGRAYLNDLFNVFKGTKWSNIKNVGIELFWPATRSYLTKLKNSGIAENIGLSISPESGNDEVRKKHGRYYTTDDLLKTVDNCMMLGIPLGVFFMIALGFENYETLRETWILWEKLLAKNISNRRLGKLSVDFGPMILLDPGSPAFFHPEKHGYKLIFKRLEDYYHGLKYNHWKYWISYETLYMNRFTVGKAILDSWETLTTLRWKVGFLTERDYEIELMRIRFEKIVYDKIDGVFSKKPEEVYELCKELVQISRDPLLTWSYIMTESEEL